MLQLSIDHARALQLAAQGLTRPPDRAATKPDVLAAIRRMGALQIDTIHVVARGPYLVLWSRLGHYEPRWLDELLAERAIFEQWSHEACFLPMDDYPLYRRLMLDRRGRAHDWIGAHPEAIARVLAYVRERGEARSADFERTDGKRGTWWDWKPEKRALESLLIPGDLMVARRERFQRVYALRESVLPDWDDASAPPIAEVRRAQALMAVRALGVATVRWLPDYFRRPRQEAEPLLGSLAEAGAIVPVSIEGIDSPAYVDPSLLAVEEAGSSGSSVTTILSPFDPVVWHRERARELFGFDFRIECYRPASKRTFGYFALPLLHRGRIVGQIDAKAHRADGLFEVKALQLAPGVQTDDSLVAGLASALARCADWHGTPAVVVRRSEPVDLASALEAELCRAR